MKKRLALLDMNNGVSNQGMRSLRAILADFTDVIEVTEFDVRAKNEMPDLSYDIYISSGGPGDPRVGDGVWDVAWHNFADSVLAYNKNCEEPADKKHVFLICHSFQMACNHFGLGQITRRQSTSFGVFPCHKTEAGKRDVVLEKLNDPFYIVDSRDYQIVQPRPAVFRQFGAKILALEKIRNHIELERAIMMVRFSDEMIGTQFHPEADPYGMVKHFEQDAIKELVIKNHSEKKYKKMMDGLEEPDRISATHHAIIPSFLNHALAQLEAKTCSAV